MDDDDDDDSEKELPEGFEIIPGAAHWASFLINGDASGLEEGEERAAENWLEQNNIAEVVGVGEPYFSNNYGLRTFTRWSAGDLADYTVRLNQEDES